MQKGRRGRRGEPKRMFMLKKSRHIRRWLVRNPWMRPMCVFNFAAIKIQQIFRGHLCRKIKKTGLQKGSKRRKANSQLNKYLRCVEYFKYKAKKPSWIDDGFSSWCAVRLQSWWRMVPRRRRHLYRTRAINQIAALVIQTAFRNLILSRRAVSQHGLRVAQSAETRKSNAAVRIQLKWRAYCNKRVYRYFRDLIKFKLKGAPVDLLRAIVPAETDFLDRAAGIHVRFRLGGAVFPPKVLFKIFTHRPLCDVNAFAPRDYSKEKPKSNFEIYNKSEVTVPRSLERIRVGGSYFGTVVSTTVGIDQWYRREERNDWRAISSDLIQEHFVPPWVKESRIKKIGPFHFSRLRRKNDVIMERKRRKREWMLKAYMFASGNGQKEPSEAASAPDDCSEYSRVGSTGESAVVPSNISVVAMMKRFQGAATGTRTAGGGDVDDWDSRGRGSLSQPEAESTFPKIDARSGSHTSQKQGPGGGAGSARSAKSQFGVTLPKIGGVGGAAHRSNHRHLQAVDAEGEFNGDLLKWSLALDFDDYATEWAQIGTCVELRS